MPQQCAQQNTETKAQQQSCPPCQKSKLKHAAPPPSKKTHKTQPNQRHLLKTTKLEFYPTEISNLNQSHVMDTIIFSFKQIGIYIIFAKFKNKI